MMMMCDEKKPKIFSKYSVVTAPRHFVWVFFAKSLRINKQAAWPVLIERCLRIINEIRDFNKAWALKSWIFDLKYWTVDHRRFASWITVHCQPESSGGNIVLVPLEYGLELNRNILHILYKLPPGATSNVMEFTTFTTASGAMKKWIVLDASQ